MIAPPAEEADPGDDVGRHPRRVEDDADVVAEVELAPAVVAADHEEAGAEADEDVRPQPCLLLAELALEPDRAREAGGEQQPQHGLPEVELRPHAAPRRPRAAR